MKRNFFRMFAVVGILGLYAACSDNSTVAPKPGLSPTTPSFDATVPFNGSGACMGDDAANVNNLVGNPAWVSGVSKPTDVNCTANDISIATTTIKQFSVGSASGPFTTLAAGDTITCTPGQTIFALAAAQLQTTATERYNIGIWIANDPTQGVQGSAVTGTCFHYNLIPNQNGSNEQNSPADQCGDMSSSIGLASVDLGGDPLVINCTPGVATVQVNNCLGWQNSDQTSSRGSCGTTNIDGNTVSTALAFRYGTLPENSSKCNCTPFSLPISVRGKITIVKNTVGGDGAFSFTSDVGSNSDPVVSSPFTITTSGGTGSQLIDKVKTGTYHIAESSLAANFDFTSLSCTPNNAFASATTSGQTATITMGNGGDITCTFTNTKRTFLTLVKTVTNDNGGTKTTSDFPLTASGPVTISGVSGTTDVTNRSVSAGSYALTEQTQAGYTASSWSCAGGTQSGANITLATGNSATCTINNNDIGATLTLVKVVTNDNGGTKTTSDFPLTASGPVTISGVSGSSAVTGRSVNAGTYALTEQTQTGYTASSWSCSGGTQSGANITLGLGGSATCTISNNDVGPTLTLIKTVTNDNGGTKTVSDFALTASGPIPPNCSAGSTSGVTGNANVTNKVLCAGTYALSEQTQAGYTASSWSCTGGTQSGANITLALAGSATCTINNNDNAPGLTLVKVVTNDNGGTKTTSDFPLTASGPVTISGVSGGTAVTARPVTAGTYALTEQTQTGYSASSWSCVGGTQSGANITLGLGESSTCTISNNDVGPTLTLIKTVTNDNGGTKTVSDFALTASGPIPPSCSAGSTSGVTGNANVTNKVLCAGTYALTEQTQAGYAASSWSCTGGTQSGANITLALAGSATCTINNNDIAPTLTLVKVVTNDNGGTKTTSDFPLTASGPVTISGVSGGTAVTARPVNAGTYALTEQTQTGYTASSWSCAGGSQTGASVALALGGSATCTIINNDNPSFIIVDKISQGGVGTFTFATTGFSMPNNNTLTTVTSGVAVSTGQISVSAGVALSVGEPSPLTGFQLMASSCVVNQGAATITATVVNGVNVTDGVTITQPGTIVECTFDNAVVSGVTRTQGFWATHTALSNLIWDTLVPTVDKQLCTATILTNASPITELSPPGTNQLMGGFWANIAKTSTKTSRTDLDQARMQALQQYLAAAINVAEFHSNTEAFLAAARVIYCGTDVDAIKGLIGTLGSYNSSGDAGAFDPGVSATAQESKKEADIPFWDVTIH